MRARKKWKMFAFILSPSVLVSNADLVIFLSNCSFVTIHYSTQLSDSIFNISTTKYTRKTAFGAYLVKL